MKTLRILTILSICTFMLACDAADDYYIVNLCDEPITISYRVATTLGPDGIPRPSHRPAVISYDDLEESAPAELTPNEYVFDSHAGTITLKVRSRYAVRIASGSWTERGVDSDVGYITVRGSRAVDTLDGWRALDRFERGPYGSRILIYTELVRPHGTSRF